MRRNVLACREVRGDGPVNPPPAASAMAPDAGSPWPLQAAETLEGRESLIGPKPIAALAARPRGGGRSSGQVRAPPTCNCQFVAVLLMLSFPVAQDRHG
jgi:hypothetical protein